MKIANRILFFLFSTVTLSCINNRQLDDLSKAGVVANKFHAFWTNGDIDSIKYLFSDNFYSRKDTSHILATLKTVTKEFGVITTQQYISGKIRSDSRTQMSTILLVYKVKSDSGDLKETFTFSFKDNFIAKIDSMSFDFWNDRILQEVL